MLATKVFFPTGDGPNDSGLSRKHITAALDASLRRLDTDYIDLYQIHRWDEHTAIEETMACLHEAVTAGKVRYVGASTMRAWQFAKAQYTARGAGWTEFVSMQNRYNLLNREDEREMVPMCLDQGVGLIPYSPLARGLLAGTRARGGERRTIRSGGDERTYRDADFDVVDAVNAVSAERSVAPAQIALAWLCARPGVVAPIVGATKPAHLEDAIAAVDIRLSEGEDARLVASYIPHSDGDYT